MAELLTRGLPGRHTRFKKTEIGEVPEGWEVVPVGLAGTLDAGKAKNRKGTPRPYLRVANVFDGEIRVSNVYEMPFTDAEFARFELRSGDVLLNEGQSLDLVGRCAQYRGEFGKPCAFQNTLLRFRATGPVSADFAEQYFRFCQSSGRFAAIATQTTSIAHLGLGRLAALSMPVPPKPEQDLIVTSLQSLDARISEESGELRTLGELKSALLSVLLTGEVRVTPDPEGA